MRTLLLLLGVIPVIYVGTCFLRFVQLVRRTIRLQEEAVWEKASTDV